MKSIVKKVVIFVLVGLGLCLATLFVVANFSATETRLKCQGTLLSWGDEGESTIFVKLTEYRWWVGLWSKSDGLIYIEIPNTLVEVFTHIEDSGEFLQVFRTYPQKSFKGQFSILSNNLQISITPNLSFEGICVQNE